MISHAGELFKREILRQVQKGYAVNVLGLGTLYLAPGSAERSSGTRWTSSIINGSLYFAKKPS
ncbi:MAG: hypothetical protein M0P01_12600 [Treponema sp.]|nr:hypothetical protein [Treponema sp.]